MKTSKKRPQAYRLLSILVGIAVILNVLAAAPSAARADEAKTTLDIAKGNIVIDNNSITGKQPDGTNVTAANPNGYIIISSSTAITSNSVVIRGGVEHTVILDNVTIKRSDYNSVAPVSLTGTGTKVNLILKGANTLQIGNGATHRPALSVPEGTELVIDTIDGTNSGGTLNAASLGVTAAIGSDKTTAAGKIVIDHGTISAKFAGSNNSNSTAAVIGGGEGQAGGTIIINDGIVVADNYNSVTNSGASIGGGAAPAGYGGKTTHITINGGTIITKVPNSATFDSIGYGKPGESYGDAVRASTTVIVNGGHIYNKNVNGNLTHLLYNRQPVNRDGVSLYLTRITKALEDGNPFADGAAVSVAYGQHNLVTEAISSSRAVHLFLTAGTQDIVITHDNKAYYGKIETTTNTGTQPNSSGTVSRTLKKPIVPVIEVVAGAGTPDEVNFYAGAENTLSVTNLDQVVNNSNYPLVYGVDFTVQWFKGTSPIAGNADDPSKLTVTPAKGETFKARFVAITDGSSKLDSSVTNDSNVQIADWESRIIAFKNLKETYQYSEEIEIETEISAGGGQVTFASSNPAVVEIDPASGALTAKRSGTAVITASVPQDEAAKLSYAEASGTVIVNAIAPSVPTGVTAEAGNAQVAVSFDAPADDGGGDIVSYTVSAWEDEAQAPAGSASGAASPITVSGLTNGVNYTFSVVATNESDSSEPSAHSTSVAPIADLPSAPVNVQATAGDQSASVSFDAPDNDGGSPITGYTVTAWNSATGNADQTAEGAASPITVNGLANGVSYTFTLVAKNVSGNSASSAHSEAITPTDGLTIPSAPTNVIAAAGNRQAVVSFTGSDNDGGSAITGYTVTAWNGATAAGTETGLASPITITGLVNGTVYTFTVAASNQVGRSEESAPSAPVTPVTPTTSPENPVVYYPPAPQTATVPGTGSAAGDSAKAVVTVTAGEAASGGLPDGSIQIAVPAGAASKAFQLTVQKQQPANQLLPGKEQYLSPVFTLTADSGEALLKPIRLDLKFDPALLKENQQAAVFQFDEKTKVWVELEGEAAEDHITVDVEQLSRIAVFAVERRDTAQPQVQLTDIAGHWAASYIQRAVEGQLVNGYPDGSFRPDAPITRAELILITIGALGEEEADQPLAFRDSDNIGAWAKRAIAQAAASGIISGYKDGSFRPNAPVTRAELATIIARAFGLTEEQHTAADIADYDDIPRWAQEAVANALSGGIITGREDNKFEPDAPATRAEAIVALLKTLEQRQ
ncbi:hypothetical protein EBB07_24905 [Paenibacillaceae bacterium]|nr:hypothetical protein EBB07_24905 [Paenibacillaceae bacterium]